MKQILISFLVCLLSLKSIAGFSLNPWANDPFPLLKNPELRAPYKACKEKTHGTMEQVDVSPCENETRCPLVKGTNVTLNLGFTSSFNSSSVIGSLYGIVGFLQIPFGDSEDLCATKQVECPLIPHKLYHFRKQVYVKPRYPSMELDTKVEVTGDRKSTIACALIPVEIVTPNKPNKRILRRPLHMPK